MFGTFTVDSLPLISGAPPTGPTNFIPQHPAYPPPPPPAAPQNFGGFGNSSPDQSDVFATLERLGGLRDKGLLSEQEFQTKKAELLSRL